MSNENKVSRQSVKSLRKQVNALKRRVEKEQKRQAALIALHKDQLRLQDRLIDLSATGRDERLYTDACEEYRIEKNERRY
jgi:uncharacterized protein involved in exopolysaccharide biosynthesis